LGRGGGVGSGGRRGVVVDVGGGEVEVEVVGVGVIGSGRDRNKVSVSVLSWEVLVSVNEVCEWFGALRFASASVPSLRSSGATCTAGDSLSSSSSSSISGESGDDLRVYDSGGATAPVKRIERSSDH